MIEHLIFMPVPGYWLPLRHSLLLLLFDTLRKLSRSRAWKQIAADMDLQFSKRKTLTYRDQPLSGTWRKRPLAIIESTSREYRANSIAWDRQII